MVARENESFMPAVSIYWSRYIRMSERGGWRVWRQDDNGNRDVVEVVESEDRAKEIVSEFEARGHKRMYWYERVSDWPDVFACPAWIMSSLRSEPY